MPHLPSAKKSLRQNAKRRLLNRSAKKTLKLHVKKILEAAPTATLDELKKDYNQAAMKLDKAAAKRVIHPNTAARRKSRLAKQLNAKAKAAAPK